MHVFGHNVLYYVLWGATLLVASFAAWKGDRAVRYAALTNVATYLLTLVDPLLPGVGAQSLILARALASSIIYLLLAIRFANLWIGAAMLLQSAQFSLYAYYLVVERPIDRLHAWINNTSEWGIVLCILVGTVLAIRRRRQLTREAAELAAMRQQRTSPRA
jgi:signal transduction histidine kinase